MVIILPFRADKKRETAMDTTLRSRLEDTKKTLNSFGFWLPKAGTTIHKSDIILAVESLERWRTEAEALLRQHEDGTRIHGLLVDWINKAWHRLEKEPLSDFSAVWDLLHINDPHLSTIIEEINMLIYKHTGDIRAFTM
jgi:hypothetical protein